MPHLRRAQKLTAAVAGALAVVALLVGLTAGVRLWPDAPEDNAPAPAAADRSLLSRPPVLGLPVLLTVE